MSRLVFVTVPGEKRQDVVRVLNEEAIEFSQAEETSGREFSSILFFALPTGAVEPILERLRGAGLNDSAITVIVETQTVISHDFDKLEEQYTQEEEDGDRIAREELLTAAENLTPSLSNYVIMTVISALIATAGLLMDSAAVVVGSMVIAPLIGPAMAANVGTVFRKHELFLKGVRQQLIGLMVAIVSATMLAYAIKTGHLIPPGLNIFSLEEVQERLRPDFLSLLVALGSGAAGVISLSTGLSSALVGVMIAVALIPPAATLGIGIAWMNMTAIFGSGVLLVVNMLSINFAALCVLWYMGYRPSQWFRIEASRRETFQRIGTMLVGILVLAVLLGSLTFTSYRSATLEQSIQSNIEQLLAEPTYGEFKLLDTTFDYTQFLFVKEPTQITVLLGAPPGEIPPELGAQIDRQIDRRANQDLRVQIRYLVIQSPGSTPQSASTAN